MAIMAIFRLLPLERFEALLQRVDQPFELCHALLLQANGNEGLFCSESTFQGGGNHRQRDRFSGEIASQAHSIVSFVFERETALSLHSGNRRAIKDALKPKQLMS